MSKKKNNKSGYSFAVRATCIALAALTMISAFILIINMLSM